MKIGEAAHIAAKALAEGCTEVEAAKAAGTSKSTISRWKREPEFKALVIRYSEPIRRAVRESADPASIDLYELIPERESALIAKLEGIIARLGEVVEARLEVMTDQEISDIPVRLLPQYVKAFAEGLKTLHDYHDRISGYSIIVDEMVRLKDESEVNPKIWTVKSGDRATRLICITLRQLLCLPPLRFKFTGCQIA